MGEGKSAGLPATGDAIADGSEPGNAGEELRRLCPGAGPETYRPAAYPLIVGWR